MTQMPTLLGVAATRVIRTPSTITALTTIVGTLRPTGENSGNGPLLALTDRQPS